MAFFVYGPVVTNTLTAQRVAFAISEALAPAAPDGQQRIDITTIAGDDPQALVGREIDISTPATPALIAAEDTTLENQKARIHLAAQQGFVLNRRHWPGLSNTGGDSSTAVFRWIVHSAAAADVVADGDWRDLHGNEVAHNAAQREAIVAGFETMMAGTQEATRGSVRAWYEIMERPVSATMRGQWRGVSVVPGAQLYGDFIDRNGVLQTPDGDFNVLVSNNIPSDFDIDSPTLRST